VWLTFDPNNRSDPLADGFGVLENLSEDRLPPGGAAPQSPRRSAEIVTYVREGAIAYKDSIGGSGVIHAGEFQHVTAARAIRYREGNASSIDWAHVFQIWLRPSAVSAVDPGREQKRFSSAERRGGLCVVASSDARRHSLHVHQDAVMFSAILEPGQHVVHELGPDRRVWLHLVHGEASVGDIILTCGDGLGVIAERAVSLTAREPVELLLFDVCEPLAARDLH